MDFEKLCAKRYSLRKFSDAPVEKEKLEKIIEAGHNAPTAHNNQPQRIFVLQSKEGGAGESGRLHADAFSRSGYAGGGL